MGKSSVDYEAPKYIGEWKMKFLWLHEDQNDKKN